MICHVTLVHVSTRNMLLCADYPSVWKKLSVVVCFVEWNRHWIGLEFGSGCTARHGNSICRLYRGYKVGLRGVPNERDEKERIEKRNGVSVCVQCCWARC